MIILRIWMKMKRLLRKVSIKYNRFFEENYITLWVLAIMTLISTAFLHYQLVEYDRDLLFWLQILSLMDPDLLWFLFVIAAISFGLTVVFVAILMYINSYPNEAYNNLTTTQLKRRFADYIYIRLLADIERFQNVCVANPLNNDFDSDTLRIIQDAHSIMERQIAIFRRDVRKLLMPNAMETSLPAEHIYVLSENDERYVEHSHYYKEGLHATDDKLRQMYYCL